MANLILASVLFASILGFQKNTTDISTLVNTHNNVQVEQSIKPPKRERLLALTIFGECRGCSYKAKLAVGFTIINRVKETSKNTIETILFKPHQFNCWDKKNKNKRIMDRAESLTPESADGKAWEESKQIAHKLMTNSAGSDLTHGATFYHATYVKNPWQNHMIRLCKVGQHWFYKPKLI